MPKFIAALVGALVVVGVGAVLSATVPVVQVKATKPLVTMLPASTALYASVNLHPDAQTAANLTSIQHAFTDQPAWKNVQRLIDQQTTARTPSKTGAQPPSGQSACYNDVRGRATSYVGSLGHEAAFALLSTPQLHVFRAASASTIETPVIQSAVAVVPLDLRATLLQALRGSLLPLPNTVKSYGGTTIYRVPLSSCQRAVGQAPRTLYAALDHGYAVLSYAQASLQRVLDTAAGRAPSLQTVPAYRDLMARLPAHRLATYYLNGNAVKQTGLIQAARSASRAGQIPLSDYSKVLKPSAGAVTVPSGGLRLTAVAWNPQQFGTVTAAAGAGASFLPSNVIAMLSLQGVPVTMQSLRRELERDGLATGSVATTLDTVVNGLAGTMAGEADLVVFRSPGSNSARIGGAGSFPLAVLWQIKGDTTADAKLTSAISSVDGGQQFVGATASDGTPYLVVPHTGFGYTVRHGWAVVSLAIAQTLHSLIGASPNHLASLAAYRNGLAAGSTPSATWYVDVRGVRQSLESDLLPLASRDEASIYRQQIVPLIAPIWSLSGSAATSPDRRIAETTVEVAIH